MPPKRPSGTGDFTNMRDNARKGTDKVFGLIDAVTTLQEVTA